MKYLSNFVNDLADYKVILEDKKYDSAFAKSVVFFDKPLTEKEMEYFNKSMAKILRLFKSYKSFLNDSDLQYEAYYKIDELSDLADFIGIENNDIAHHCINDFRNSFNFSSISDEQVVFLMLSIFFDQLGDKKKLEIEARDGKVFFEHSTMVEFAPRVRDRLSFLVSLFFDKNFNIFNGMSDANQKEIEAREYIILLDCNTVKNNIENIYAYLISNKRSVSFGNISWKDISKLNNIDNCNVLNGYLENITEFLFEDLTSEEEKSNFRKRTRFLEKNENKIKVLELQDILEKDNEKKSLNLVSLSKNSSLRYNFAELRFKKFFSNIKREKDLIELLQNMDKENDVNKKIQIKRGKI